MIYGTVIAISNETNKVLLLVPGKIKIQNACIGDLEQSAGILNCISNKTIIKY